MIPRALLLLVLGLAGCTSHHECKNRCVENRNVCAVLEPAARSSCPACASTGTFSLLVCQSIFDECASNCVEKHPY